MKLSLWSWHLVPLDHQHELLYTCKTGSWNLKSTVSCVAERGGLWYLIASLMFLGITLQREVPNRSYRGYVASPLNRDQSQQIPLQMWELKIDKILQTQSMCSPGSVLECGSELHSPGDTSPLGSPAGTSSQAFIDQSHSLKAWGPGNLPRPCLRPPFFFLDLPAYYSSCHLSKMTFQQGVSYVGPRIIWKWLFFYYIMPDTLKRMYMMFV